MALLKWIVCLACACLFDMAFASEDSVASVTTVNVTEGHDITVTCNATSVPGSDVFWTKNEMNSTFSRSGRDLTFLNISRVSKGEYLCHTNQSGTDDVMEAIYLDVQYPARITHAIIEPYVVDENSTFNFSCGMEGHPAPHWYIGNRDTGEKVFSATLPAIDITRFVAVRCGDSGYWECRGHNSLNRGVDVFRGHNVSVECSPRPQQGVAFIVYSDVNTSAVLSMDYLGEPAPEFSWTGPGSKNVSLYPQSTSASRTTLTIPRVQISDFGNYTLTMKNRMGEYSAQYTLAPKGRPQSPSNLEYSNVTDNKVTLRWTAGYNMGTWQQFRIMVVKDTKIEKLSNWFVVDNSTDHGAGREWTVEQTALDSETTYTLTVVAENNWHLTSDPATPYVTFRTAALPKATGTSHLGVTLASVGGAIVGVGLIVLVAFAIRHWRRIGYMSLNDEPKKTMHS